VVGYRELVVYVYADYLSQLHPNEHLTHFISADDKRGSFVDNKLIIETL